MMNEGHEFHQLGHRLHINPDMGGEAESGEVAKPPSAHLLHSASLLLRQLLVAPLHPALRLVRQLLVDIPFDLDLLTDLRALHRHDMLHVLADLGQRNPHGPPGTNHVAQLLLLNFALSDARRRSE